MSTIGWTNAGDGDWNVDANWSGGVVPMAADDAVIALPGTYDINSQFVSNAAHVRVLSGRRRVVIPAEEHDDLSGATRPPPDLRPLTRDYITEAERRTSVAPTVSSPVSELRRSR